MDRDTLHLLAGLAHELRTPISAIAGHTSLLSMGVHGPLAPAQAESMRRIQNNQQQLLTLINDFMRYAEAASGAVKVAAERLAMGPILSQAVVAFRDGAAARGVRVVFDEQEAAGERDVAELDAVVLRSVLDALLQDALVHSSRDSEIHVRMTHTDRLLCISVSSDGETIVAESAGSVFVPYARDGAGRPLYSAGGSLALPVARTLSRAMGAELRAVPHAAQRIVQLEVPRSANLRSVAG